VVSWKQPCHIVTGEYTIICDAVFIFPHLTGFSYAAVTSRLTLASAMGAGFEDGTLQRIKTPTGAVYVNGEKMNLTASG
jgi:hypothetical protein